MDGNVNDGQKGEDGGVDEGKGPADFLPWCLREDRFNAIFVT